MIDINLPEILKFTGIFLTPIVGMLGFMLRRALVKLDNTITKDDVRVLIDDRLTPLQVNQRNIEHEINRIERKLDKIIDILIKSQKHG